MNKRTMRIAAAGAVFAFVTWAGYWSLTQATQDPARPAVLDNLPPPVEHELAQVQPGEIILGDVAAPVTIIEYASLSCPHCANFHKLFLPDLKSQYLDTGKAKLVLRDFPLNKPAVEGALLARCVSPLAYWAIVGQLFSTQQQWVTEDSLQQLSKIAATAGISTDDFTKCQANEEAKNSILSSLAKAESVFGINSTPT
ncbi:MAG: DsbA family protein, partial [Afipia sp.]|nr:DsbA family protein [Afipia sp.]